MSVLFVGKILPAVLLIGIMACATGCDSNSDTQHDSAVVEDLQNAKKLNIAHRGASGYLPEHSLASKAVAHAMGADYIEQDVVMTKDDRLVVLHDYYLDRVTNIAEVFPDRKRDDGRYYAIDFTLAEIRQLKMTDGFKVEGQKQVPIYPSRFPLWKSSFVVHTLEEEIELIQGLNQSTGRDVGIYVELKAPWFHRSEGKDISKAVLRVLKEYGYDAKDDLIYLQCFDPSETRRIHDTLFDEFKMELKLIQLIAETSWSETLVVQGEERQPYSYDWMHEPGAMKEVAKYADGIGVWYQKIVNNESKPSDLKITNIVNEAHGSDLQVHAFTFRADPGQIPDYAKDFDSLLHIFLHEVGIDGVFTDFPDKVSKFLER